MGRIPVVGVGPVREGGRWPARAVTGESVPVTATVFRDGHDLVGATAVLLDPSGAVHSTAAMHPVGQGLDQWEGRVIPDAEGEWSFRVEGWSDPYGTWAHDAGIKVPAGQDVELVLATGAAILGRAAARDLPAPAARALRRGLAGLADAELEPGVRLAAGTSPEVRSALAGHPLRDMVSASDAYPLRVVRGRALAGAWYEVFPRSMGAVFTPEHGWETGTLRTAAAGLDRIAAMGFDVLYLTPVHPIGTTFRKGRNNALAALPGDPGSPYAIGSPDGGHDAIHPDLGDFGDFDALVARARELGMEVALDLALQCSPDHPWVTEHPEWFTTRLDGTIAHAENPPKKYQDIYPLNFDNDPEGIYREILRIIRLWMSHGVRLFRVDNPHTKPLPFWERLLAEVAATSPDVLFLAEAFTRPPMMSTLALVGFQQSYTYFAWRNTKAELAEYLAEVSGELGSFMRPAFWPTTHDILTPYMQAGGQPAFAIRAILAATGAPTWGVYSGYELVENVARPGSEEQSANEQYHYKSRDFTSPTARTMTELITRLNAIRAAHPALRRLRNLTVHPTSDDATLCFSRRLEADEAPDGQADTVVVVVNLDPHNAREGVVYLDLAALGIEPPADWGAPAFTACDELTGARYEWSGQPFARLDPWTSPAHVMAVLPLGG
ncbi:MAG: alpha-1,4-glucan--maltose-1-phosphate maltosyltransferase [Bifidobacteriaceae bacterium]|jgi:starch synthase (maltosyl-transferring)|nr:alpha-1,4-glucan--maltose-1-phosphate maltosyltransferase [Bifidobacteriaceae bacterium]